MPQTSALAPRRCTSLLPVPFALPTCLRDARLLLQDELRVASDAGAHLGGEGKGLGDGRARREAGGKTHREGERAIIGAWKQGRGSEL